MDGFANIAWYLLLAYMLLFVFLLCMVKAMELLNYFERTTKCCTKYAKNEENGTNTGGIEESEDDLELIIWD